ncbi:MAG: WD40 repeat domain-containing protein [Cyanobacteria bacterium P01_A01_bin.135]
MEQSKARRSRGVTLSAGGLQRLTQAIQAAEAEENGGDRFTNEALSDRCGISSSTLSRIWTRRSRVDRRTMHLLFSAFSLELRDGDGTLLQTLTGHDGYVTDVVFSPDGEQLVSAGWDGSVRIWDRDGAPVAAIAAHDAIVRSVAVSPDGQWIASAGEDSLVKLWTREGELVRTFAGHQNFIWDVAFSPDGKTLASASWDNTVIHWRLDGEIIRTFENSTPEERETRLVSVAFSPDGQTLAAGEWFGRILWWDIDGPLKMTAAEHVSSVVSLAFSLDGQTLASSAWDQTIKLWRDGALVESLSARTWEVAFSPDGARLISGGEDTLVRIWQLSPEILTVLRGHLTSVYGVTLLPNTVLSASTDNTVRLWDQSGKVIRTLSEPQGQAWDVQMSPDGQRLSPQMRRVRCTCGPKLASTCARLPPTMAPSAALPPIPVSR